MYILIFPICMSTFFLREKIRLFFVGHTKRKYYLHLTLNFYYTKTVNKFDELCCFFLFQLDFFWEKFKHLPAIRLTASIYRNVSVIVCTDQKKVYITSTKAMLAPGRCTVHYKDLYMCTQKGVECRNSVLRYYFSWQKYLGR